MQSPKPREVLIILIIAMVLGLCWDYVQHVATAEPAVSAPQPTMTAPAVNGYPGPDPYPGPGPDAYPPPVYLPTVLELENYP